MTYYRMNEKKHGVEIIFDAKPSDEIRTELKSSGFRWNGTLGYWYATQSADRIALAARLADQGEAPSATRAQGTPQDHIKIYWNGLKIDGGKLIKCGYSLDNNSEHRPEVSIYCHSYGPDLPRDLFKVRNETDIYTDYFDNDHATVTPAHPLYKYIRYAAAKADARMAKRHIEYLQKHYGNKYADQIARSQKTVDDFEAMTDPGQPTAEDLAEINRQRQEEENARQEAEHEEELRQREKYLNDRAEGRRLIDSESTAHPMTESGAYVLIHWSEHPAFCDYEDDALKLSLTAANNILGALDMKAHSEERGYYKTKFTIYTPDGSTYSGRYDLGDGEGDLIGHIESLAEWDRTHAGGQLLEFPPETTQRTEYAKTLRKLVA